jgi:hypothetical protein
VGIFDDIKKELHLGDDKDLPPSSAAASPAPPAPVPVQSGSPAAAPQTLTPASQGRVLLIHGYSADWKAFLPWRDSLAAAGIATDMIDVGNYVTLNNEVTIKDLGEAFDRALRMTKFAKEIPGDDWTFDAIVHSTGMLVLREWLTSDPFRRLPDDPKSRIRRLKHLVGLAPATFGSPQAKKGRSWLGALVKGNRDLGPDFLNAGDLVLDGLELASRYTWELAHQDMICPTPFYDKGDATPYIAIFIGNTPYSGISGVANTPGCDGTVRWAGCGLDARKVSLDFRRHPQLDPQDPTRRSDISPWSDGRLAAPMIAVDGKNHGTIISNPDPDVVKFVHEFLGIKDAPAYQDWENRTQAFGKPHQDTMNHSENMADGAGWQQFVVRIVDNHGDGVSDFNLQIFYGDDLGQSDDPAFAPVPLIADTYSSDSSYRCFYIHLRDEMLKLKESGKKMWVELIASSGSNFIEYEAYTGSEDDPQRLAIASHDATQNQPVKMDITELTEGGASLFYPYTTTLLEIFVEREPMPLGGVSALFTFPERMPPAE